jgi:lipoic acid synthetase
MNPTTTLETLIPDFQGIERNIDRIIDANPEEFPIIWKQYAD